MRIILPIPFFHSNKKNRTFKKGFDKFDKWCNEIRAKYPLQFLNCCWIRPKDVKIYENLGVDILKIPGKTPSTNFLLKVAKAYLNRGYNGNVMDLFTSDWWPERKKPYINNFQLNGFIEYLWSKNLNKISSENLGPYKKINYEYEYKN